MKKMKEQEGTASEGTVFWIETSGSVSRQFQFESNGRLSVMSLFLPFPQFLLNFRSPGINWSENFENWIFSADGSGGWFENSGTQSGWLVF